MKKSRHRLSTHAGSTAAHSSRTIPDYIPGKEGQLTPEGLTPADVTFPGVPVPLYVDTVHGRIDIGMCTFEKDDLGVSILIRTQEVTGNQLEEYIRQKDLIGFSIVARAAVPATDANTTEQTDQS